MGRKSKILKLLYDLIISDIDKSIDSGRCPHVKVFYNNNENDGESFTLTISSIDESTNIINVSNTGNMSLALKGIDLSNREINNSSTKDPLLVEEHINFGNGQFTNDDELKLVGDISNLSIGNELSLDIANSIFLKTDIINLPRRSYGGRSFYKMDAFVLSLTIQTRNDENTFELEDITDAVNDIFEDKYSNIILNDGTRDYTVRIIDGMKVFDIYEKSTSVQRRTMKIMLGYSVVNEKYLK